MSQHSKETVQAVIAALKTPLNKSQLADLLSLSKDANSTFTQSGSPITGITAYDLQAPALSLFPVITPLVNTTPRVGSGTGTQANWRAITAINTAGTRPGVGIGQRGGVIQVAQKAFTASYKGLGTEVNTDFEADYAAQGFDDPRQLATLTGLRNLKILEEQTLLWGNSGANLQLGTTPTPNLADVLTGGALLQNQAYFVVCAALTPDGYTYGSVSGGVQGLVTRSNADGSTIQYGGGTAKVSAEATVTTANSGGNVHSITASLTAPVVGACAYAWFLSTATGTEKLVAITTAPTVTLTALPAAGNQLASSLGTNDNSGNSTVFDGLITLALTSGSGASVTAVSGTLTSDSAGGIVQIDAALKSMWDVSRLGPSRMLLNSQEEQYIGQKILNGSTTAAQRFVFATDASKVSGGIAVATYRNKFSMTGAQDIKLELHPNMPPGMIIMLSDTIPYPMSGVGNVFQVKTRKEYNQIDWPVRTRMWESGVYVDEVLQHYAPFSMAVLYDVRPG